jgi:hypothetical protein
MFKITSPVCSVEELNKLIIKGNAQFYRNDRVFRNPERFNINRLVFMTKITL